MDFRIPFSVGLKLAAALLLSACYLLHAQVTRHVPSEYATVQAAIDSASNGDTVLVAPGIYYESIRFAGRTVMLKSEHGPDGTILDANYLGSVVTFDSGEGRNSVLQGFTIQHGRCDREGGGIRIANSSPTIIGNRIRDNSAANGGGGIGVSFGSPLIRDNTVSNNGQSPGYSGGIGGGGISVGGSAAAEIAGNLITQNTWNSGDGGGISLFAAGSPVLTNNRITGNTAFGKGGGIAMYNEVNATIVNNLITGNAAGSSGGGVYFLVPYGDRGPWLINNTIADNSSTLGPGVFADGYNGQSALINNIVTAASGAPVYCGSLNTSTYPVFEYNDVSSPSGADYGGLCPSQSNQNGNISADPLFTGPASGVYTVRPNSPVIDAGTSDRAPATDLAGAARPLDGNGDGTAQFDMGAYEAASPPAPKAILSSVSLAFAGLTPVGTTAGPQVVTLTNAGNAPLAITTISASGAFTQANDCGPVVSAGYSCNISVMFSPQAAGDQQGAVTIVDNAAGGPRNVSLAGSAAFYSEAESPSNTLSGQARIEGCSGCSGGAAVGRLGNGALRLSNVPAVSAGSYQVDLYYTNAFRSTRSVALSVNGGPAISVSLSSTSGTTGLVPIGVKLNAGANTLTFSSAPSNNIQIDRIAVHQ